MADVTHLFPSDKNTEIPMVRATVPVHMAECMVLAQLGGAASQLHLIAEYFLTVGKHDISEKISDAARLANDVLKTFIIKQ